MTAPTLDCDWIAPVLERRHSSDSLDAAIGDTGKHGPRKRVPSPNYRHYPAEDNPSFPRTFATTSTFVEQDRHVSRATLTMETLSSGLSQSAEVMSPTLAETGTLDSAGNILSETVSDTYLTSPKKAKIPSNSASILPFNPSQYGLVHLAPLSTTWSDHSRNSSQSYDPGPGSIFSSDSKPSTYYSTNTHQTSSDYEPPEFVDHVPKGSGLAPETLHGCALLPSSSVLSQGNS